MKINYQNRYKNKVTSRAGFSFASKLEAALYDHLCLLESQKIIKDIRPQPHVYLTEARIHMIPDFSAFHFQHNGIVHFEAKGFETDVYRIKRKLWQVYGPTPLFVYKGTYNKVFLHESIIPTLL